MRMQKQFLRCFAECSDGVWVAYCLDFGLGAQGETFEEAKQKLEAQLQELAHDLKGVDSAHARQLRRRGAPLWLWARYWVAWAFVRLARAFGKPAPRRRKRFVEPGLPELVAC